MRVRVHLCVYIYPPGPGENRCVCSVARGGAVLTFGGGHNVQRGSDIWRRLHCPSIPLSSSWWTQRVLAIYRPGDGSPTLLIQCLIDDNNLPLITTSIDKPLFIYSLMMDFILGASISARVQGIHKRTPWLNAIYGTIVGIFTCRNHFQLPIWGQVVI